MSTAATPDPVDPAEPVLCLAFETGVTEGKIACSTGPGQPPRFLLRYRDERTGGDPATA